MHRSLKTRLSRRMPPTSLGRLLSLARFFSVEKNNQQAKESLLYFRRGRIFLLRRVRSASEG
uniref:Unclassified n=1 Tax=Fusarium pseudograminearum CS3220 TaxID=1318456 RepID=W1I7J8_FUSPS|nr:unclassified [Fusarium pseudograminearum CS3220]CDX48481.1 unclassified [Fusarium pseudograminearum CS3220]